MGSTITTTTMTSGRTAPCSSTSAIPNGSVILRRSPSNWCPRTTSATPKRAAIRSDAARVHHCAPKPTRTYACTSRRRYVGWAKALFAPCPRGRDVPHHVGTAERRPSQIRNASAAFAHPTDLFRYACTSRRRPSTGPKRSKSATAALSSCALALPRMGAVRSSALAATSSALMGLPGVPRTS
jgi:hypothetical protein